MHVRVQLHYGNNRKRVVEILCCRSLALSELLVTCCSATISTARKGSIKLKTRQTGTGNEMADDLALRTEAYFSLIQGSRGATTWHFG